MASRKQKSTSSRSSNKANTVKTRAKTATPRTRDSLVKLRAHVDDIEKRLKRANSLTRSSVTALKTAYETLAARSGQSPDELASQIEAMSANLNGLIAQTRKDVAHDLQLVLEDPRFDTLASALSKANKRLSHAEQAQAQAIRKINTQIADLATVIDARFRLETRAREENDQVLAKRLDDLEANSAQALNTIGQKVIKVSEHLQQKTSAELEGLKQAANEHFLAKQQDFEAFKDSLERRVEAIEDDQRNTVPSIERRLLTLATRVEALEDENGRASAEPERVPPPPVYSEAPQTQGSDLPHNLANIPSDVRDAFSPETPVAEANVPPPPALSATPPANIAPNFLEEGDQGPIEFTPEPIVEFNGAAPMQPQMPAPEYGDNPYAKRLSGNAPQTLASSYSQGAAPEYQLNTPAPETLPPPPVAEPQAVAPPPMPPAIEEMPETMESARPGVEHGNVGRLKKLKGNGRLFPTVSRPLKLAALMVGAAAIGLLATKIVMPKIFGSGAPVQNPQAGQNGNQTLALVEGLDENGDVQGLETANAVNPPVQTLEPIGDYQQGLSAPDLGPDQNGTNPRKQTLLAAATGGNPIAQFQLGLNYLETGRESEAVRLIRLAANQNQPAAQYRLAKLYEAGIGVKKSPETAFQLLKTAANAGNRIAMHDLGNYYVQGLSQIPADFPKAALWFAKAAEFGVLDSQFNLGVLYQEGSGVERNLEESYFWFSVAANQGDKMAAARAKAVANELSPAQLDAIRTRVNAFTPKPINEAANGMFRNLPWAMPERPASQTGSDIVAAQKQLLALGYDVGKADGAMGPKTRNAIIRFERANGLPETGRVNAALVERLNLAAGS